MEATDRVLNDGAGEKAAHEAIREMRAKDVVRMFWLVDVDLCASRTPLFMRCVVYARVGDGLCDLGSGGGVRVGFCRDLVSRKKDPKMQKLLTRVQSMPPKQGRGRAHFHQKVRIEFALITDSVVKRPTLSYCEVVGVVEFAESC